jgi:F-type H+-transporting ATPase subunit epsilon
VAKAFRLAVVAPDRTVFDAEVASWVAPAALGYLGVWGGHEPTLVALKPGVVEIEDTEGRRHAVAVGGGFAEIRPDGVTLLAEDAQMSAEVDAKAEEARIEEARRALRGESSSMTQDEARRALDVGMGRLRAARMR